MHVTLFLSLVVAIIGALMYLICKNPKLARIGEILFFAGALAFLFQWPTTVKVLG